MIQAFKARALFLLVLSVTMVFGAPVLAQDQVDAKFQSMINNVEDVISTFSDKDLDYPHKSYKKLQAHLEEFEKYSWISSTVRKSEFAEIKLYISVLNSLEEKLEERKLWFDNPHLAGENLTLKEAQNLARAEKFQISKLRTIIRSTIGNIDQQFSTQIESVGAQIGLKLDGIKQREIFLDSHSVGTHKIGSVHTHDSSAGSKSAQSLYTREGGGRALQSQFPNYLNTLIQTPMSFESETHSPHTHNGQSYAEEDRKIVGRLLGHFEDLVGKQIAFRDLLFDENLRRLGSRDSKALAVIQFYPYSYDRNKRTKVASGENWKFKIQKSEFPELFNDSSSPGLKPIGTLFTLITLAACLAALGQ